MRSPLMLSVMVIGALGFITPAEGADARQVFPSRFATDSAHNCGWVMFSKYKPREVKRLAELPDGIRRMLREYLTNRLGEAFYRRFSLSGGQVVDWPEFRKAEPSPGYKWKVFTYNLMFAMRAPEVGIERYCAAIELDAAGDVISMKGFPPSRRLPRKANLVPLSQAYATAKRSGFNISNTSAELVYDAEIESMVYRLTERFGGRHGGRDHIIEVDVHDGRRLKVRWENWFPHY